MIVNFPVFSFVLFISEIVVSCVGNSVTCKHNLTLAFHYVALNGQIHSSVSHNSQNKKVEYTYFVVFPKYIKFLLKQDIVKSYLMAKYFYI